MGASSYFGCLLYYPSDKDIYEPATCTVLCKPDARLPLHPLTLKLGKQSYMWRRIKHECAPIKRCEAWDKIGRTTESHQSRNARHGFFEGSEA